MGSRGFSPDGGRRITGPRQRSILIISMIVIGAFLLPATTSGQDVTREHVISLEELPGGLVSPGGASSFTFEYEYHGGRAMFWGWTGPNDIRVMGEDLATLSIIDLPSEDFEVGYAGWSHGGSIIVLGRDGAEGNDTLLVYRGPRFELDASFMPREAIPLATLDAASLLADDNMLAVAGRDPNGTSRVLIIETSSRAIRTEHDIHENLTIQTIKNYEMYVHAMDVQGGSSLFETSRWGYAERIEPIVGPCHFSVVRTNHPLTYAGVDGRLVVKEAPNLNQTFSHRFDQAPVLASTFTTNNYTANIVVATTTGNGGSRIQVFHNFNGSFEAGPEVEVDMTVTSMMAVSPGAREFGVAFSDGAFRRYRIPEDVIVHQEEPEPPEQFDPEGPNEPDEPDIDRVLLALGIAVAVIAVVIVWWVVKVRAPKKGSGD